MSERLVMPTFNEYLDRKEAHKKTQNLEDSANAFYWKALEREINHQDSSVFIKNHFGRIANQIKMTDSETVQDALINCVLFRLIYSLAELQCKYQVNQAHSESEKQLERIGRYTVTLYKYDLKALRKSLVAAFNRASGTTHITDTASRTLHAVKTANEQTLVQIATSLLGGANA